VLHGQGAVRPVVRPERAAAGGGLGPVAGDRGRLAARDSGRGARDDLRRPAKKRSRRIHALQVWLRKDRCSSSTKARTCGPRRTGGWSAGHSGTDGTDARGTRRTSPADTAFGSAATPSPARTASSSGPKDDTRIELRVRSVSQRSGATWSSGGRSATES